MPAITVLITRCMHDGTITVQYHFVIHISFFSCVGVLFSDRSSRCGLLTHFPRHF